MSNKLGSSQPKKITKGFLASYSKFIAQRYAIIWLIIIGGLSFLLPQVKNLQFQVDLENLFLDSDQNYQNLLAFRKSFGLGDSTGIFIKDTSPASNSRAEGSGLVSEGFLGLLEEFQGDLENLANVKSVRSLATIWQQSRGEGAQRLEGFERYTEKFSDFSELLSSDKKSSWVLVELLPEGRAEDGSAMSSSQVSEKFAIDLEKLLATYEQRSRALEPQLKLEWIPVGLAINGLRLNQELTKDLIRVVLVAALLCVLLILILLRSVLNSLAVILCLVINPLLVFSLSAVFGLVTDKTFVLIPILLGFASSIGYCVHLEKDYLLPRKGAKGEAPKLEAYALSVQLILRKNWKPLSFAAGSTIIALLSFLVVPITIIRNAGIQSTMALFFSYTLSLSLFPSLLRFNRKGMSRLPKRRSGRLQSWIYSHVIRLALASYRRPAWAFSLCGLLIAGSIALLPQLRVDLSTEKVLGTRLAYVQRLMEVSNSEIGAGGFYDIELVFADDPLEPATLNALLAFQAALEQRDLVKNSRSVARFIRSMEELYRAKSSLPNQARGLRQGLKTWEHVTRSDASAWYNPGQNSLRILVQVKQGSSAQWLAHIEDVNALAAEYFADAQLGGQKLLAAKTIGGVMKLALMNQYITSGLLRSFLSSLFSVLLLFFILLASLRTGLLAMIPNIFPVLLTAALIVLSGASLEFVSMTIGPMILGLAVDDTIFFLGHINRSIRRRGQRYLSKESLDLLITTAIKEVSPALITTTLILVSIFATMFLSQAQNIRNMGLYTISAMLAALLADLLVTPALVRLLYLKKRD